MIFFDEVQKCPEVITWIKFLVDEGSCEYALSGNLLGVELKEVFPLDIEEFSRCLGLSDEVLTSVGEAFEKKIPVDEAVHAALMKMIHLYLVVGGMPAAVQAYVDTIMAMDLGRNHRHHQDCQSDIILDHHQKILLPSYYSQ